MMRWVEAEMCPIPFCHRPSHCDHCANQHVCPDMTADWDRPRQTVFFDDSAADIIGHSSSTDYFTNKANSIHSL